MQYHAHRDEGIKYVQENFPFLDMLTTCTIQRHRKVAPPEASDTDASALILPENTLVMGLVFASVIVVYALLHRRRKNQAKTQ